MRKELIIPFLIMCGFVALLIFKAIRKAHLNRHKKDRHEQQPRYAHPAMDLRLKASPCDTCLRWEECNGVDLDNCKT